MIITVCFLFSICALCEDLAKPVLVEIWCRGDDLATRGLRDALENSFESSAEFTLNHGKNPSKLILTIPDHVDWKKIGDRTKIYYIVEFSSAEKKKIRTQKGSCWKDDYVKCTEQIIKATKSVVRKLN
ncbi:MAG: hypothetical protein WBN92_09490 [Terriglobia bacterium]